MVAWESYMTPCQPEYIKHKQVGALNFFGEKSPQRICLIKPLTKYNSNTFCEE
jgi:hypothetical protein